MAGQERIIVGYVADRHGRDALALGCFLAAGINAEVVITMILPEPNAYGRTHVGPFTPADDIFSDQLREWSAEALAHVPAGIDARVELRYGTSTAHGLLDAVTENNAQFIAISTHTGPLVRSFTLGSTANTLLHSCPVPVALAPSRFTESGPVSRITGVYGLREDHVIERSITRAAKRNIPVRLLSLVELDGLAEEDIPGASEYARAVGDREMRETTSQIPIAKSVSIEIAQGRKLEDAIKEVSWQEDEVAILGSSRLSQDRVFLGSRSRRILAALPVPAVILPARYHAQAATAPADSGVQS